MRREIYLDNSATTRPYDEVIEFMSNINRNIYGNPSSLHTKGIEAEKLVRNAREIIAETLQVQRNEIYFTSGGTEANNLAILGYLEANPRKGKHIITSKIEHPSVLEVYKHLEGKGYKVDYLDVDSNGLIDVSHLEAKITRETSLVSIIFVNNEIGTIQPIKEIAETVKLKNKETAFHVDAVQAYGKIQMLPRTAGVDMMSASSHKIHGPKGVGVLYVNKGVKIKPLIMGGGQEQVLRSGTENVPGICGFGMATSITFKGIEDNYNKCMMLKNMFIEGLKEKIEDFVIISPECSSPYILNVSFARIRAEVLLHHLEAKKIFVSTGSACSSRKNIHSHVLKSIGITGGVIEGAIRFSFSEFNTIEEVKETVEAVKNILPGIIIRHGGKR